MRRNRNWFLLLHCACAAPVPLSLQPYHAACGFLVHASRDICRSPMSIVWPVTIYKYNDYCDPSWFPPFEKTQRASLSPIPGGQAPACWLPASPLSLLFNLDARVKNSVGDIFPSVTLVVVSVSNNNVCVGLSRKHLHHYIKLIRLCLLASFHRFQAILCVRIVSLSTIVTKYKFSDMYIISNKYTVLRKIVWLIDKN